MNMRAWMSQPGTHVFRLDSNSNNGRFPIDDKLVSEDDIYTNTNESQHVEAAECQPFTHLRAKAGYRLRVRHSSDENESGPVCACCWIAPVSRWSH